MKLAQLGAAVLAAAIAACGPARAQDPYPSRLLTVVVPLTPGTAIDILARLGTAFDFEGIEAENAEVEGIVVPVATPRMLYRMKKDTVRPQDRADAERLRREFHLEDE